jgi:glutathione S-transferase
MQSNVKLGYWAIQGAAENSRFALANAGVKWEEYNPESREAWAELKPTLGFDFPNLPFLEVDGFKMTESNAMPVYIARKFKPALLGHSLEEEAKILEIINVLNDVKKEFYQGVYSPTPKEKFEAFNSNQNNVAKIGLIAKYLGEKHFLVGDHATLADICVATFVFTLEKMYKSLGLENWIFTSHSNLHLLHKRVYLEVEGIKEFVASEEWKNRPLYPSNFLTWIVNDMTIN